MITALLLQAAAVEASTHPYLTWALVVGLFTALVTIIKVLLKFFEDRVNEKFAQVEGHNTRQDGRLDAIEGDIRKYDTHVAVGVKESGEIHSAISRVEATLDNHVHKEETVTWQKIDDLVEAVNTMRLSNAAEHAGLVTGQAVLGTRMDAVEKKMPNGELQKLADAFANLADSSGGHVTKKRVVRGKK